MVYGPQKGPSVLITIIIWHDRPSSDALSFFLASLIYIQVGCESHSISFDKGSDMVKPVCNNIAVKVCKFLTVCRIK